MWRLIGTLTFVYARISSYVGMANFLMLFYIFIQNNEWLPWYGWLLVFLSAFGVLGVTDVEKILPETIKFAKKHNPYQQMVCKRLGLIEDKLGITKGRQVEKEIFK